MLNSIITAIMEVFAKVLEKLIKEDKKATDADTPKAMRDSWDKFVRDSLRDD